MKHMLCTQISGNPTLPVSNQACVFASWPCVLASDNTHTALAVWTVKFGLSRHNIALNDAGIESKSIQQYAACAPKIAKAR